MMTLRKALAVLGVVLSTASFAQAQNSGVPNFLQNLPAGTVIGRLALTPGPAQAIPFASLVPKIVGVSVNSLIFTGATSGSLTLSVPAAVTSYGVTLPAAVGTSGQALTIASVAGGIATMQWSAATGTVDTGAVSNVAIYTGANRVGGTANMNVAGGVLTAGVAGATQGGFVMAGSGSGSTTLAAPTSGGGTWTFQAGSDTIVGRATTDTLTNKTLTAPAIAGGTHTALTALGIRSTGAAFDLTLASSEVLTAGRTLSIVVGDAARTLSLGGNLTTAGAFTTSGAFAITLTATNTTTLTLPLTGTLATLAGAETLTNKTLTTPIIATISNTGSLTLPTSTDTLVGRATTDTLTNKTLTAPAVVGGSVTALTSLGIRSTGTGAFDLTLANSENLTAGRTLTLTLNNASRTLSLSGDLTTAAAFTTAGGNAITLTTTGSTGVTLPTSGTLATINTSQTFSGSNIFSALQQFTDAKFSSGKIYPTSDSTTALQVTKADGATVVMDFDTTNRRVGINKTPGAFDLDVSGALNIGGIFTFGTIDATSLGLSTSTITGLTVNNTPTAANDYAMYYSAADGRIRKITLASLVSGSVAGVANANGLTGGITFAAGDGMSVVSGGTTITFNSSQVSGGRLTLASGSPVMTASQSAKSTIYFDCHVGRYALVYNGTSSVALAIPSCEYAMGLDAVTPRVASGSLYDVFAVSNAGALVTCVGPAWSSSSSRGTGAGTTQIHISTSIGFYTNQNALTHCYGGAAGTTDFGSVSADQATYLGTFLASANGQTQFIFGAAAVTGGTPGAFNLWNAYNRRKASSTVQDTSASYSYIGGGTIRQVRAGTNFQISFVLGLVEDGIDYSMSSQMSFGASNGLKGFFGVGLDSTSTFTKSPFYCRQNQATNAAECGGSSAGTLSITQIATPGSHILSGNEESATGAVTFNLGGDASQGQQLDVSILN